MAPPSFSDDSEDDRDAAFEEDMEYLRRACLLTGAKPSEIQPLPSPADACEYEADSDDDLKLVRSIRERFSFPSSALPLSVSKPEGSHAPGDSDEDDDFETLRAIQRRFAHYDKDGKIKSDNNISKDALACTTTLTSEWDTSTILLKNSNNREALGEGFPDSGDIIVNSQLSKVCDSCPGSQPCDSIEWHQQEGKICNSSTAPLSHATFPEIAQMFIAAIKKNRSCQKFIRSKIIQVESRIEENKRLKERVKCLMDFQASCKRRATKLLSQQKDPRVKLISLPRARTPNSAKVKDKKVVHTSCLGPAENSHVPIYRMVFTKFPVSLSRQQWSKVEKENLAKGIKQQFQEVLLQRTVEQYSDLEGPSGDFSDLDNIIKSIANLEVTPENIRCFLPQVDWERLAAMYVMGRSGVECQTRWLNHEDPMINNKEWTNLEDKNLLLIVQQRGICNWIEIATEMATSMGKCRTPFQCLARYQGSLNAYILKRDWTEDEDAQLRAAVETLGESNWQRVATTLGGRTGTQCSNRWRKSLHPSRQRVGRWSVDEDKRLKISVMLFGPKSWNKIAEFIPGRTQVQCRERWFNTLDPSLKLGPWSKEEELKLKEAITDHGYCWSKVAACLPGRTDSQCRRRWKVLFPQEVPLLQAARKIQRVALISNFVDREKQRPALGPSDFVSASVEINSLSEDGNKKCKAKQRTQSSDNLQLSSSKKSRTKAKTCFEESSREMNDDDALGDHSNSLSKKRTKKRAPKPYLNGSKRVKHGEPCEDRLHSKESILPRVADDASSDGNLMINIVSRVCKPKRSRTKCKVSPQEVASESEYDNNVISHGGGCNSIPKKRTKKPRKAHPSGLEHAEPAEAYGDLSRPENAILSTVENDASLNENSRPKVVPHESKFSMSVKKQKWSRKQVAEIEYDDDATLASVFCDILKRRKLKFASTGIVLDQAIEGFTMRMEKGPCNSRVESDGCNQPAEELVDRQCGEDSILRVMHSNDGSIFHGTPKTDDISQWDKVRNLMTKRKESHQENSIMMDVSDRSVVYRGVGTFGKGNSILRKHDKKACKSAWVDKRIHPVKDCEALLLVDQSVPCEKLRQDTHKRPEIESEFRGRCSFAADGEEEPLATHETAILLQDCEAESHNEQTTRLALPCGTNPSLPLNVSLPSEVMDADRTAEVMDADRTVDYENCCPFGDSNGGLDDLLLFDGGMVDSSLDFLASDDVNVTEAPLALPSLEGGRSLQPSVDPLKTSCNGI